VIPKNQTTIVWFLVSAPPVIRGLIKHILQREYLMKYIARISGRVDCTLLCDIPGTIASSRKDSIQVELAGLVNDRHYGHTFASNARFPYQRGTEIRNSRQVSIISSEEMAQVAAAIGLAQIQPEWLGANLLVSCIPALTLLPPASRMHFEGGAVLVVQGENDPCSITGAVIQKNNPGFPNLSAAFVKAALHRRGLVAWVEKAGEVQSGSGFEIEIPEQFDYTKYL
jgi:hypothetical protein